MKTLPNLKAEMARENINNINLEQLLKKSKKAIVNRLNCTSEFNRNEMFLIQEAYFPKCSLDYLFKEKEEN